MEGKDTQSAHKRASSVKQKPQAGKSSKSKHDQESELSKSKASRATGCDVETPSSSSRSNSGRSKNAKSPGSMYRGEMDSALWRRGVHKHERKSNVPEYADAISHDKGSAATLASHAHHRSQEIVTVRQSESERHVRYSTKEINLLKRHKRCRRDSSQERYEKSTRKQPKSYAVKVSSDLKRNVSSGKEPLIPVIDQLFKRHTSKVTLGSDANVSSATVHEARTLSGCAVFDKSEIGSHKSENISQQNVSELEDGEIVDNYADSTVKAVSKRHRRHRRSKQSQSSSDGGTAVAEVDKKGHMSAVNFLRADEVAYPDTATDHQANEYQILEEGEINDDQMDVTRGLVSGSCSTNTTGKLISHKSEPSPVSALLVDMETRLSGAFRSEKSVEQMTTLEEGECTPPQTLDHFSPSLTVKYTEEINIASSSDMSISSDNGNVDDCIIVTDIAAGSGVNIAASDKDMGRSLHAVDGHSQTQGIVSSVLTNQDLCHINNDHRDRQMSTSSQLAAFNIRTPLISLSVPSTDTEKSSYHVTSSGFRVRKEFASLTTPVTTSSACTVPTGAVPQWMNNNLNYGRSGVAYPVSSVAVAQTSRPSFPILPTLPLSCDNSSRPDSTTHIQSSGSASSQGHGLFHYSMHQPSNTFHSNFLAAEVNTFQQVSAFSNQEPWGSRQYVTKSFKSRRVTVKDGYQSCAEITSTPRKWHILRKPTKPPGSMEFTIMSYNILAQELMENHMDLYSGCRDDDLRWDCRGSALMRQILAHDTDIVCLQEVQEDHWSTDIRSIMEKRGYAGVYKKRVGDKPDGCAIFFKHEKFKLLTSTPVEFFKGGILDRDNIGIIVLLQPVEGVYSGSNDKICVATTHLLFNPKRGDIKLAQLMVFLAEIDKLAYVGGSSAQTVVGGHQSINDTNELKPSAPNYETDSSVDPPSKSCVENRNEFDTPGQAGSESNPGYCPIILCGDFNSEPFSDLYNFITRGYMRYEGLIARLVCGQREGRNWGSDRFLGKKLLPPSLSICESCQYTHVIKGRDSGGNRDDADKGKGLQVNSGQVSHSMNFRSVYRHFVDRPGPDVKEVSTFHNKEACTVDYIFYSRTGPAEVDSGRKFDAVTSDVQGSDRDCEAMKPESSSAQCGSISSTQPLELLARYRLLSTKEVARCGKMPNSTFPSDHLCLIAKFLLR